VGLPGTIEEAHIRATFVFLSGGQVDISDNFLTLPDDRWDVLFRTLPPLGITARPVDLFEPMLSEERNLFDTTTLSNVQAGSARCKKYPGSVWHIPVHGTEDDRDLVGLFALKSPEEGEERQKEDGVKTRVPSIFRFEVPLRSLKLDPKKKYLGYEFWSGQFLGMVPGVQKNPHGYRHPGDLSTIVFGDKSGVLDVVFSGPAVKLLCLRERRPYPWVVGTSFHQSVGSELKKVTWHAARQELRGELHRPAGENGRLTFYSPYPAAPTARVNGAETAVLPGAFGAWVLPLTTQSPVTEWSVRFPRTRKRSLLISSRA